MVLKISAAKPALWRNTQDIQIGTGNSALVLSNISRPEQNLLALLYKGIANDQLDAVAAQSGLAAHGAANLIERLEPVLMNEPVAASKHEQKIEVQHPRFYENAFTELAQAELENTTDGVAVLRARASRSVHVDSLGKAGLMLARGLAASGVGRVVSHDSRQIAAADIGADGYEEAHFGQSRLVASGEIIGRVQSQTRLSNGHRMSSATLNNLDCAVLIAQQVIAPARYAIWQQKHIPYLAITFGQNSIDVSPIIVPGISPCLNCLAYQRIDEDSSWTALATQLIRSPLRFDDASSRLFATGLALRSILQQLDRGAGSMSLLRQSRGFSLDLQQQRVVELDWNATQRCDCQSAES